MVFYTHWQTQICPIRPYGLTKWRDCYWQVQTCQSHSRPSVRTRLGSDDLQHIQHRSLPCLFEKSLSVYVKIWVLGIETYSIPPVSGRRQEESERSQREC